MPVFACENARGEIVLRRRAAWHRVEETARWRGGALAELAADLRAVDRGETPSRLSAWRAYGDDAADYSLSAAFVRTDEQGAPAGRRRRTPPRLLDGGETPPGIRWVDDADAPPPPLAAKVAEQAGYILLRALLCAVLVYFVQQQTDLNRYYDTYQFPPHAAYWSLQDYQANYSRCCASFDRRDLAAMAAAALLLSLAWTAAHQVVKTLCRCAGQSDATPTDAAADPATTGAPPPSAPGDDATTTATTPPNRSKPRHRRRRRKPSQSVGATRRE